MNGLNEPKTESIPFELTMYQYCVILYSSNIDSSLMRILRTILKGRFDEPHQTMFCVIYASHNLIHIINYLVFKGIGLFE